MRAEAQRQWIVFLALLAVLAVVIYVQFGRGPSAAPAESASSPSNPVSRNSPAAPPGGTAPPVTDVKLEMLESARGDLAEAERNPFRFSSEAPPERGPDDIDLEPLDPDVAVAEPTGPPPIPPITMRYIGVIELPPPEGRMAILSDGRGGPPVPGKEGDIIEGRYRLLRVGPESIDMAYLDGRGRQTIQLSGQ